MPCFGRTRLYVRVSFAPKTSAHCIDLSLALFSSRHRLPRRRSCTPRPRSRSRITAIALVLLPLLSLVLSRLLLRLGLGVSLRLRYSFFFFGPPCHLLLVNLVADLLELIVEVAYLNIIAGQLTGLHIINITVWNNKGQTRTFLS
jgi:hypothetical protein